MSIRYEIKKENLNKIPNYFLHDLFFYNPDKYQNPTIFENKNIRIELVKSEYSFSLTGIYPNTYKFEITIYNIDTSEYVLGSLKITTCQGIAIGGDIDIYYEPYDWLYSALKIFDNNLYYFLSYYKKILEMNNDAIH